MQKNKNFATGRKILWCINGRNIAKNPPFQLVDFSMTVQFAVSIISATTFKSYLL